MKLLLAVLPMAMALAQPAFDVASVKPSPPPPGDLLNINLGTEFHGEVTLGNTTLSECIRYAYDLVSEDQITGPDWIRERRVRFDIIAKAPASTPHSQLVLMMQTLLAERFRLAIHREPRKIAHFELTVAKGGPKLQESTEDGPLSRKYYGNGHLWYVHISIGRLAVLMSRVLKQPVIDHTGLTGIYDVNLEWSPDDATATSPASESAAHPDLFSAVSKQLGLKLESSKQPLEVIVVDRAEQKPVEN